MCMFWIFLSTLYILDVNAIHWTEPKFKLSKDNTKNDILLILVSLE